MPWKRGQTWFTILKISYRINAIYNRDCRYVQVKWFCRWHLQSISIAEINILRDYESEDKWQTEFKLGKCHSHDWCRFNNVHCDYEDLNISMFDRNVTVYFVGNNFNLVISRLGSRFRFFLVSKKNCDLQVQVTVWNSMRLVVELSYSSRSLIM